jgi:hypothetical protein
MEMTSPSMAKHLARGPEEVPEARKRVTKVEDDGDDGHELGGRPYPREVLVNPPAQSV